MSVDVRRFPWIRRLAADYAYDFPSVSTFFTGDPADPAAWGQAIARTHAHHRRGVDIAAVIAGQQRRRNAPPAAIAAAQRLADPQTVAVVTGQQAGLFGGPTFTLLKALTALKLAARVTREHRVPCVAVFWIDAEDHDWDEVRTCQVFDESLNLQATALPPRKPADYSTIASVRLDDSVQQAIQSLEETLPATEFKPALLEELRSVYKPGAGMADAFGAWLEWVLGSRGLVVYDASDPAAKPLACDLFTRELSMPGETNRRAAAAGADLVARGYHSQVNAADTLALFHVDGGRRPIRQQDGVFVAGEQTFEASALVAKAAAEPRRSVRTSCSVPSSRTRLFPTVCYVAGPNELAYLGQLRGVYEHFGVPMPIMYPRASATLLDSAALRFLTKYDVPLEALQAQDDSALNTLLASQIPASVNASLDARRGGCRTRVDPGRSTRCRRSTRRLKARRARRSGGCSTTCRRCARRRSRRPRSATRRSGDSSRGHGHSLFPGGEPQERAVGFVTFLNQYGPALVQRLDEQIPIDLGKHWLVVV